MDQQMYLMLIGLSLLTALVFSACVGEKCPRSQMILLGILILVLLLEISGHFTGSRKINNSLIYNVGWVYMESFCLISYFLILEKDQTFAKKIKPWMWGAFSWGLVNSLFFQSITEQFQFFSFLPLALIIVFLAGRTLFRLVNLKFLPYESLTNIPHFWTSTTVLFFHVEAILLFGAYQFFPDFVVAHVRVLFGLNRLIAALMYLSFGLSFFLPWLARKKSWSFNL